MSPHTQALSSSILLKKFWLYPKQFLFYEKNWIWPNILKSYQVTLAGLPYWVDSIRQIIRLIHAPYPCIPAKVTLSVQLIG